MLPRKDKSSSDSGLSDVYMYVYKTDINTTDIYVYIGDSLLGGEQPQGPRAGVPLGGRGTLLERKASQGPQGPPSLKRAGTASCPRARPEKR